MPTARLLNDRQASELAGKLSDSYKNVHYYLSFGTPIDLVAAAIISAQTRDETVNRLTPALFAKYRTAKDYAGARLEELTRDIGSVTFAGNKAKNMINTFKTIAEKYGGKVPSTMEQLTELPGIGRKTANTILINAYGIVEGIPVDTWVIKLSYRLGLSLNKNPEKIEQDLTKVIDKKYWHNFAYILKAHGKAICQTVPYCGKCPVSGICPKNGVTKRY
jgi:endonuclease-3